MVKASCSYWNCYWYVTDMSPVVSPYGRCFQLCLNGILPQLLCKARQAKVDEFQRWTRRSLGPPGAWWEVWKITGCLLGFTASPSKNTGHIQTKGLEIYEIDSIAKQLQWFGTFVGPMFEAPMDPWPNSTKPSCVYKEHIVGLHILRAAVRAHRGGLLGGGIPLLTVCQGHKCPFVLDLPITSIAVFPSIIHWIRRREVTFGDPRGSPDAQSHLSWLMSRIECIWFFGAYRW